MSSKNPFRATIPPIAAQRFLTWLKYRNKNPFRATIPPIADQRFLTWLNYRKKNPKKPRFRQSEALDMSKDFYWSIFLDMSAKTSQSESRRVFWKKSPPKNKITFRFSSWARGLFLLVEKIFFSTNENTGKKYTEIKSNFFHLLSENFERRKKKWTGGVGIVLPPPPSSPSFFILLSTFPFFRSTWLPLKPEELQTGVQRFTTWHSRTRWKHGDRMAL